MFVCELGRECKGNGHRGIGLHHTSHGIITEAIDDHQKVNHSIQHMTSSMHAHRFAPNLQGSLSMLSLDFGQLKALLLEQAWRLLRLCVGTIPITTVSGVTEIARILKPTFCSSREGQVSLVIV